MVKRRIIVDMDNCILNAKYHKSHQKNVILHNNIFLERLIDENKQYSDVQIASFSLRNSVGSDAEASRRNGTGSSLLALQQIADYLQVSVKKLLLSDIFEDLAEGESFTRFFDGKYHNKHPSWYADQSKLLIAYAHGQSVDDEDIVIDFYDDLDVILKDNLAFFATYPTLLPKHVTCRFHEYMGDMPIKIGEVQGSGEIDLFYRQTIIDMTELSIMQHSHPYFNINKYGTHHLCCVTAVTPKSLERRRLLNSATNTNQTIKSDALIGIMKGIQYSDTTHGYNPSLSIRIKLMTLYDTQQMVRYETQLILENNLSILHFAVFNKKTAIVHYILEKCPQLLDVLTTHPSITDSFTSSTQISALELAMKLRNDLISTLLIQAGATMPTSIDNHSIIDWMSTYGLIEAWFALLEKNPALAMIPDNKGNTILHVAVDAKLTNIVKSVLIKFPTQINITNHSQATALDIAICMGEDALACELINVNVCISEAITGIPILLIAVYRNMNESIKQLITRFPHLLETRSSHGHTLLHIAALKGNQALIAFLLSLPGKIDLDARTSDEPFDIASQILSTCSKIRRYGESLDLKTETTQHMFQRRQLGGAVLQKKLLSNFTALDFAIHYHQDITAVCLLNHGATLTPPMSGTLHMVHVYARTGDLSALQLYFNQHNADVVDINLVDEYNQTCLLWAAARGHVNVVTWLLERGANPLIPTKIPTEYRSDFTQDENNRTPKMWAEKGRHMICCVLLSDATRRLYPSDSEISSDSSADEEKSPLSHSSNRFSFMYNNNTINSQELPSTHQTTVIALKRRVQHQPLDEKERRTSDLVA